MLPLLLCLQVEPSQAAQVLFAYSLVYSGPAANACCCVQAFSLVVASRGCYLVAVRGFLIVVASLVVGHNDSLGERCRILDRLRFSFRTRDQA